MAAGSPLPSRLLDSILLLAPRPVLIYCQAYACSTIQDDVWAQVKALEAARYAQEQESAHREAMEERARRKQAHQQ